ncbi:hypothetical protein AKJ40_01230 [candidate division MSBL1 archaeon SCGC-AAA259M10]|uniref:Uncharacterized protein n=1 Tax=candidate division MSBL1 archaeon SCGC-AAA259M10 TaxID=1698270 RepID=A0A133V2A2_9EURY|nr:hypothetical protein AKJ40_01230 [candidate division MSBL1 archaeon SCGC-AAA259M10]
MFEAEETARVDAPRDLVWEWITDLGNFASQIPNATVVENGEREVTIRDSFHWVNFPPEIGEVDLKISKIEESDKVMRIKGGNRNPRHSNDGKGRRSGKRWNQSPYPIQVVA